MLSDRPFFRLRDVRKVYRTGTVETRALDAITLDIRAGEFVAVRGPSGCGKSTLLNIVAMLDLPTSGQYALGDVDVSRAPEARLAELRKGSIGFIFQNFLLVDDLTVFQNVELPLICLGVARRVRRMRVREVLELVELEHRADHRPAQLSGGQQQRVGIARAMVGDPRLIVADEPTGNLDSRHAEDVLDMLTTLNQQGTTILMVTHSAMHAGRGHRTVHMLDGRLVDEA